MSGGWALAPHVCKTCLGRILQNGQTFHCASCGAEAEGSPIAICGCGIRIAGMPSNRRLSSGFTCTPNPERGPASPAEFVILFDGAPTAAPE